MMTGEDLQRQYPQFSVPDARQVLLTSEGGYLRASLCVHTLSTLVRQLGGEIRQQVGVAGCETHGEGIHVRLNDGTGISTARLIETVGPWSAQVLAHMGLHVSVTADKQQVVYIGGLDSTFAANRFPVFICLDQFVYGFPLDAEGYLKLAVYQPGPAVDPDGLGDPDPVFTDRICQFLAETLPQASRGTVSKVRLCMYAMTPDEDFILDYFLRRPQIVVGAGFSGHGFKFAPLIGELLAALVLEEAPSFSVAPFAITRFAT
jgi:glycine/D-amino acid oxidase-like deaminating enzyme